MVQIAIIGGGIGGLTAALALQQSGFECEVFEQAPALLNVGAAIALWPNAMRVLQRLSLAEKILELVNGKSKLVFQPLPVDDPMQRCPDITLARKVLEWEPKVALDDGLKKTIAYFDGLLKSNKAVRRVGR